MARIICHQHCPSRGSGSGAALAPIVAGAVVAAVVTVLWPVIERVLIIAGITAGVLAVLAVAAFSTGLRGREPVAQPMLRRAETLRAAEAGDAARRVRAFPERSPRAAVEAPRPRVTATSGDRARYPARS